MFNLFLMNIKIGNIKIKNNLYLISKASIGHLSFNKIEIFLLSVILGFGLVKILINLINPPFGWDDLNYHFTFAVEWLKHRNLENPIVAFCDPSPTYYPVNGSLFFLWFILPLKNVFIADLGQVPFFIIAFFVVYSLARKIDLSKEYAFFSASMFVLVPNYFKQLNIAYVDIMVAALFLAASNYLFLIYKNKENYVKITILYSISLGLMLGTKTTALPYVPLLFIPFFVFCITKLNFKKCLAVLTVSVLFLILMGGFSYFRNLIETGNPLYPLNLKLFNEVIMKGVMDSAVYRAHTLPKDYSLGKILFSEGLGAQTVIFLLPAIFLGLPLSILKRKKDLNFNFIYFMLLPFLLFLTYRFIIPLANLRYIYNLLGIGFIIAFYVADVLKLPKIPLKILIIICALTSFPELAKRIELVMSILLVPVLFFTLPHFFKLLKNKNLPEYVIFIVILLFLSLVFLQKDYVSNEYSRYIKMVKYSGFWPDAAKAWHWLNQNTKGNNIAYAGRPAVFPLYGTDFKNNAYYVSVNKIEPAKIHYYPNSKYVWGYDGESVHRAFAEDVNYRGRPDYFIWLSNLLKRNTGYLFIYSLHQIKTIQFPVEDQWGNAHPEVFDLVFKNDTIHIYKIKK
ncbi:MAG: hypothetical protein A2166_02575 [Omnitrophica WOR_2 bacterium RBG_13_41_10]|nr:MAG: hypothetical protein A2166_02575 [Omnitrophica WOR_2 bacterium RBG_13_41_10]